MVVGSSFGVLVTSAVLALPLATKAVEVAGDALKRTCD
jgi:hypothetical protein